MKKITFIIIGLFLIFYLCGCGNQEIKSKLKKVDKRVYNIGNVKYVVYELYPELVEYMKNQTELKKIYSEDKKIVSYWYGGNCPYGNAFSDAMKKYIKDEHYSNYYNFNPQTPVYSSPHVSWPSDAPQEVIDREMFKLVLFNDFMTAKGMFSVINPAKNQVFTVDGVGYEEAAQIKNILDELLLW